MPVLVLSYSPNVEAYALVGKDRRAVDLSADIVNCTVSRKTDATSEFSMTLQNKGWKYNGLFTPLDPIEIYSTKRERVKLFSGYVTKCDAFQLYQGDFNISGYCTLYRIQQMYWDPLLLESQQLMHVDAYQNGEFDNGHLRQIINLLTQVGGWPETSIEIQPSLPQDIIDYAHELYQANLDSSNQLKSMLNDFYRVLQEHSPQLSGFLSSGDGTGDYDLGDENLTKAQREIIKVALHASDYGIAPIYNQCLGWVNNVFEKAGYPFTRYPAARDVWFNMKEYGGTDVENAPPASVVVGDGTAVDGIVYGHIGIVVTQRNVAENVGYVRIGSIPTFFSWQTKLGWVAIPGVDYARSKGGGRNRGDGSVDFGMSESKFVAKWGQRIDRFASTYVNQNYFAFKNGDLYGHGDTIARESYRNGVDPRIVCAIAGAESGYGNRPIPYGGSAGPLNYWSWSSGLWSTTVDGVIAEFCSKFATTGGIHGKGYAGMDMEECIAEGYGGAEAENAYIRKFWTPVIEGI